MACIERRLRPFLLRRTEGPDRRGAFRPVKAGRRAHPCGRCACHVASSSSSTRNLREPRPYPSSEALRSTAGFWPFVRGPAAAIEMYSPGGRTCNLVRTLGKQQGVVATRAPRAHVGAAAGDTRRPTPRQASSGCVGRPGTDAKPQRGLPGRGERAGAVEVLDQCPRPTKGPRSRSLSSAHIRQEAHLGRETRATLALVCGIGANPPNLESGGQSAGNRHSLREPGPGSTWPSARYHRYSTPRSRDI